MTAFVPALWDIIDWLRTILFGWADFLRRVLPDLTIDANSVAVAAVALVFFTLGVHVAAKRLYRKLAVNHADLPLRWRFKWTLSAITMTFILFAAGISLIGLTHQIVWLATSNRPAVQETARPHSVSTENSLKWLSLAIGLHSDMNSTLPPGGTFTADGTGLHSWETHILIGLNYASPIDLKRPWRHAVNENHFRSVLPELINPGFRTAEFRDAEGFGLSHFASNVRTMGPNTTLTIDEITDGRAETILIGEVNTSFRPWGDPVNWRDPSAGLGASPSTFGGPPAAETTTFLMADGSVRSLHDEADPKILQALATPAAED